MTEFSNKNFGLLIAYVLPGFIGLCGVSPLSPTIGHWLATAPTIPAGLDSIAFVGLASITMGMTMSAARWLLIDTLHAWTGLPRPPWNDAILDHKLQAFEAIVEAHFRHYQFYANSMIAIALAWAIAVTIGNVPAATEPLWFGVFLAVEALFLATSRNTLRNYYQRTTRLLGTISENRRTRHGKRTRPRQAPAHFQSHRQQDQAQDRIKAA
jgi:hypothetical protein